MDRISESEEVSLQLDKGKNQERSHVKGETTHIVWDGSRWGLKDEVSLGGDGQLGFMNGFGGESFLCSQM